MKIKGFIVALLTVFFFAGTALAGGPATMKTDVPTIPEADCDQAGWISLEVLGGFDMHEGDVIVWSTTNLVPLCKDIDIFLSIGDVASNNFPQRTDAAIFTTNAADTVEITGTDQAANVATQIDTANGSRWELGFLIQGTAGSNQITLTVTRRFQLVAGADNPYDAVANPTGNYVGQIGVGLTAGGLPLGTADLVMTFDTSAGDPTDVMTIRLFDSNNEAFVSDTNAGWWEKDTVDPFGYTDGIEEQDNVLCLDTNNDPILVNGQYVWATPDSQPGNVAGASQVSFSGDFTIANISGSEGYATGTVGKGLCQDVTIGASFDQFGNPIGDETFLEVGDYNDVAAGSCTGSRWSDQVNICPDDPDDGFGVLVTKSTNFATADRFRFVISLAVSDDGGNTYNDIGADDAWFNSNGTVYETNASNIGNIQCDGDPAVASALNLTAGAGPLTDTNTNGDEYIIDTNYAVVQGNMYDSFIIDVGQIGYLKSQFSDGDIIALKVQLYKFPCGLVETDYVCLATAVEDCGIASTTSDSMYFPYGVSANSAAFWTGIAITNVSAEDGVATLTFWGVDGNVSTYDLPVSAYGISSIAVSAIFDDLEGDLTADENFQVTVSTDYAPADGICFVGGKGTNTVLHGYLPRLDFP